MKESSTYGLIVVIEWSVGGVVVGVEVVGGIEVSETVVTEASVVEVSVNLYFSYNHIIFSLYIFLYELKSYLVVSEPFVLGKGGDSERSKKFHSFFMWKNLTFNSRENRPSKICLFWCQGFFSRNFYLKKGCKHKFKNNYEIICSCSIN